MVDVFTTHTDFPTQWSFIKDHLFPRLSWAMLKLSFRIAISLIPTACLLTDLSNFGNFYLLSIEFSFSSQTLEQQGSPRILRSSARDAAVQRAIIDLHGGSKVSKRSAQSMIVNALDTAAKAIKDAEVGIRPGEGIIELLCRTAKFSELSATLATKYERSTPAAQKQGGRDQLTALAHAADRLLDAAGSLWDWMSLEFYVWPHLPGEEVDYEVDDEVSDEDSGDGGEAGKKE
ncbi:hypothetical protein VTK26DRAFT_1276 [Humicola hyalothermophila]